MFYAVTALTLHLKTRGFIHNSPIALESRLGREKEEKTAPGEKEGHGGTPDKGGN